jgi:hypothetical protein
MGSISEVSKGKVVSLYSLFPVEEIYKSGYPKTWLNSKRQQGYSTQEK